MVKTGTWRLKVTLEEVLALDGVPERCWRVLELLPEHDLEDVHGLIQREFRLGDDHLWAFYLSGEPYDRDSEFSGQALGAGRARGAALGALGLEEGMSFAYLFDFGDAWRFRIDVSRGEKELGAKYPRVVERVGVPPSQGSAQPEVDAQPEVRSALARLPGAVAQVARALDEVRGAQRSGEVLEAGTVRGWLALARRVLWESSSLEDLYALSSEAGGPVDLWVQDVVEAAGSVGLASEGRALAERLALLVPGPWTQTLVVSALLADRRRDEALRRLRALLPADGKGSRDLVLWWCRLLRGAGEVEEAERRLRALLAPRWVPGRIREEAVVELVALLDAQGRAGEVESLMRQEQARVSARMLAQDSAPWGDNLSVFPRGGEGVGRVDSEA